MFRIPKCNCRKISAFGLLSLISVVIYGYIPFNIRLMNGLYKVKPEVVGLKTNFCNQTATAHDILPNVSVVSKMDIDTLYLTFTRYILTKQVHCCDVSREGPVGTYGKNICLDNFRKLKSDCLVYSLGHEILYGFENALWTSYGCEIYHFDPSFTEKRVPIPAGGGFRAKRDWIRQILNYINKMAKRKKTFIDIMKLDIEGLEWIALPILFGSGLLRNVKQLCLKVHFGYRLEAFLNGNRTEVDKHEDIIWGNVTIQNQLQILKRLYDFDFRIFMSDPIKDRGTYNLKKVNQSIDTLVEISLVNIRK